MGEKHGLSERIRQLSQVRVCDLADRLAHDGTIKRLVEFLEQHHEREEQAHEGCRSCALIIHVENEYQDVIFAEEAHDG